ncbi:hypothetical protein C4D60_Mb09t17880 [Musa balbisiana]|uniref:Rho-GAP domain-containing protein n=1 Tax=Musa balbisiana TaxID=52838 RepID=A0A4S8IH97_MUSBA|nr:hypothetical protein C4D60_Mb09t17880 [Musa balbisiana]
MGLVFPDSFEAGADNVMQCKTCRCGEGDTNFWITRGSDNPDKQSNNCPNCNVFKSGPLFISSKGIGWTSWKKRWFVLTRTSLVFFRTDPAALPQKGSEANVTLGGIDLNNSGSVVVKADKKILTVLFPDGRDGRTFTLKAETSEDLYEWKAALENALTQAPSAALALGQNGIFQNDITESIEASHDQWKDTQPATSTVIGRPILLALEDIDGSPSFLEKALRFIERQGIKVEGILRQSADVEEVKCRVREYEQGKNDFSSDEDAHVVGDCIKYVLRELPSSPVPASCCTALVEAYRTDRGIRVDSMRTAIYKTFPEPNRRLLQRILKMMQTVAENKSQNRMSLSALAACMAPLLLRPLLAGDCEFEDDFNMGGDGSLQLLRAAAAANHAQAIVIILLEQYDSVFDVLDNQKRDSASLQDSDVLDASKILADSVHDTSLQEVCQKKLSSVSEIPYLEDSRAQKCETLLHDEINAIGSHVSASHESIGDNSTSTSPTPKSVSHILSSSARKAIDKPNEPVVCARRPTIWGRTSAKKNLSMESIDLLSEDEIAIQKLENTKNDLQNKIAKEVKGNAVLQESLERRKEALDERRLTLERDIERLREQLQKERDLRASLESGLMNMRPGHVSFSSAMDSKTREDLEEVALAEADIVTLKQKVADLRGQLNHELKQSYASLCKSCGKCFHSRDHSAEKDQTEDVSSINLVDQHENFLKQDDALSGVVCGTMPAKEQELPSSREAEPPQYQNREPTSQTTISSGSRSASSTKDSIAKLSSEDEDTKKTEAQGLLSSSRAETSSGQLQANQCGIKSPVSSCISNSEEPVTTTCNSISKNSTSRAENSPGYENMGGQCPESMSSSDGQPPQKQRMNIFKQSSKLPQGPNKVLPSAEESVKVGENTASKKFSLWGQNVKKEAQDPSLSNKQSNNPRPSDTESKSLKSQTSASVSSSVELALAGLSGMTKKHSSRPEEQVSSSASALAKLTNRLNFLKERRAQLVNELQFVQNSHTLGQDGPPPRTNSR